PRAQAELRLPRARRAGSPVRRYDAQSRAGSPAPDHRHAGAARDRTRHRGEGMAQAPAGRRWLRYAAWAAAAGIAIGVALAVVVTTRFEPEDLARLLSTNVKARTGRELVIEGPVGYSLSLVPMLYAENVRLQN